MHGGLDRDAENYLRHLEETDPARFERSCRNARRLTDLRKRSEDPKPWFYAGLFSLATPEEAERFAGTHWLTSVAIAEEDPRLTAESAELVEKLGRIREALARVRNETA